MKVCVSTNYFKASSVQLDGIDLTSTLLAYSFIILWVISYMPIEQIRIYTSRFSAVT